MGGAGPRKTQHYSCRFRLLPVLPQDDAICRLECNNPRESRIVGAKLQTTQRQFSEYLENARQVLAEPLDAIQAEAGALLASPAIADDGDMQADVQRIAQAAEEMASSLDVLRALGPGDETELARLRHNLRNGVGVVDGYADILLEDCSDQAALAQLRALRRHSRDFQEQLDTLAAPLKRGDDDPIAAIFRSFKSGLGGDARESISATILVVDDNDSSRELLAVQLQRQDHTVIEAADGKRCLEVMRSAAPDLVLLDLVMPDMNGYEVLQAIRNDDELRRIPVVVISGVQDEEGAIHCIDAGASDYLIKPVNATLLKARVGALLEAKQWQDRERQYLAELEKSERFIRKVFGRYLSNEIVQRLLDDSDGLKLGGQRRVVTVLMADIRDFSTISRELEPERCVQLLNNYLGVMTEVIQRYRGTVDEFVGDGILAIFGAPVSEDDDGDRALGCAVAMQLAMAQVNRRNAAQGLPQIAIGIGLNTGDVVAGNIGSERRSKYGVVGHNVNLAARVESCTVGGQILASPSTVAGAKVELLTGQTVEVMIKGEGAALPLSEILGVGLPYDLVLPESDHQWRVLAAPQQAQLAALTDKRLADQRIDVEVLAVRGRDLQLRGTDDFQAPCDVCVFGLTVDEALYGKLLPAGDGTLNLSITSWDSRAEAALDALL